MQRYLMPFLVLAALSSCADFNTKKAQKKQIGTHQSIDSTGVSLGLVTQKPVEKPVFVPESMPYQASKTIVTDLIHTKLDVSFDWNKQYLFGEAYLTLSPYFYPQSNVIIDAKGFDIERIALVNEDGLTDLTYTYPDSLHLDIQLDRRYTKSEKYVLFIKYTAKPNELDISDESSAISDDKGLYFINPLGQEKDKPRQIWTQGETESSSCWFPTMDQPNEKTTQEISITVDTAFVTISNGELQAQLFNENGTRTDYWLQEKPHAPYLFMMAIGDFAVIQDNWYAPESKKQLEVNYYVEKEYAQHAMKIFGNTPEMLGFFSKKLGYEYPWDKYSQVIVRDYVSGAMENTTASVFMEALQVTDRELLDKNWDYIIAHELFHHWFGDLVTCESWSNLPLNESFANYSEYLWGEYKYGRDYADFHRQEELSGYLRQAAKAQFPIVRFNYNHRMDMFDAHSYNKGGLVLHMLRKQIGDEAFFESLRHYLHKNEYTDAEIHELRLSFEEITGQDLNWFFNQWFLSPGHPSFQISKTFEQGQLTVRILQQQDSLYTPYFRIPTDLEVLMANGDKKIFPVLLQGRETLVNLQMDKAPQYVILDSEQSILGEFEYQRDQAELINLYRNSERYQARYDAMDGLIQEFASTNYLMNQNASRQLDEQKIPVEFIDSLNTQLINTLTKALDDPSQHLRKEVLFALNAYDKKNQDELLAKYQRLAKDDAYSLARAQAVANLSALYPSLTDSTQAVLSTEFLSALEDSSYAVVGEGLLACVTNEIEGSEQYIDQYRASNQTKIIKAVAQYYVLSKDSTQSEWIKRVFDQAIPADKIELVSAISSLTKISKSADVNNLLIHFQSTALTSDNLYERYACYRILHALDSVPNARVLRQEIINKEPSSFLLGIFKGWESSLGL